MYANGSMGWAEVGQCRLLALFRHPMMLLIGDIGDSGHHTDVVKRRSDPSCHLASIACRALPPLLQLYYNALPLFPMGGTFDVFCPLDSGRHKGRVFDL